jgi:hypothetical protein
MSERVYVTPGEIREVALLKRQAQRRRAALVQAGCSTYALGRRGGTEAIQCLCCGLGSGHPTDIAERFCGFCQAWHSEWREDEG